MTDGSSLMVEATSSTVGAVVVLRLCLHRGLRLRQKHTDGLVSMRCSGVRCVRKVLLSSGLKARQGHPALGVSVIRGVYRCPFLPYLKFNVDTDIGSYCFCSLGGGTGAMDAGLGYALYIDADGQTGSTAACETFACPALIDANDPFAPTSSPTKTTDGGSNGSPVPFTIATTELILLTDVPCMF